MIIFLIGYMSVGKTSIGKKLANKMDLPFYDLDHLIEKAKDKSVTEIFNDEGETVFRGYEKQYLAKFINEHKNGIIATGGGTPCFYDNLSLMNKSGTTVYLRMNAESLAYRLEHSKSSRPLVSSLSSEEIKDFVKHHLAERENSYEQCQIIFETMGMNSNKMEILIDQIKSNQTK